MLVMNSFAVDTNLHVLVTDELELGYGPVDAPVLRVSYARIDLHRIDCYPCFDDYDELPIWDFDHPKAGSPGTPGDRLATHGVHIYDLIGKMSIPNKDQPKLAVAMSFDPKTGALKDRGAGNDILTWLTGVDGLELLKDAFATPALEMFDLTFDLGKSGQVKLNELLPRNGDTILRLLWTK